MTFLGIDPGTTRIGYAVIESGQQKNQLYNSSIRNFKLLDCGLLETKSLLDNNLTKEKNYSYSAIAEAFQKLISAWKPDIIAIEKIFFSKNSKTAMAVSEVRGVLKLITEKNKIALQELAPNEVKLAVTGYGLAKKQQVYKILTKLIEINKPIKFDDVSDAIAIALTSTMGSKKLI